MSFLTDAAKYYKAEPHQVAAWEGLEAKLPEWLLKEFQTAYRAKPEAPVASPVKPTAAFDNSWDGIYACGLAAGAKFPECVAAQWALESAYGKHTSGKITSSVSKAREQSRQLGRIMGTVP